MLIDQLCDTQHHYLVQIAKEYAEHIPLFKTAQVEDSAGLPDSAFAFPEVRVFPVHTPEHAVLSRLYANKQASHVPTYVSTKIDNALRLYDMDPSAFTPTVQKQAAMREDHCLLPQHRRFYVRDRDDIIPAANGLLAQRSRLKTATLADASVRLVKLAGEYDFDASELPGDILKLAGLTICDAGVLLDNLDRREVACADPAHGEKFAKIAQVVEANFPKKGVFTNRNSLLKIAEALEIADQEAGLVGKYGRYIPDPLHSVFNTTKLAEPSVEMGGTTLSLADLAGLSPAMLEDVLGPGAADGIYDAQGNPDIQQLQALLSSLPDDIKSVIGMTLGSRR